MTDRASAMRCGRSRRAAIFWTQMRKSPLAIAGGVVLALFYLLALLAPFVAPYPQEEMDRAKYFHPPQRLHWFDADGSFSLRPFVRDMRLVDLGSFDYEEDAGARAAACGSSCAGMRYELLGVIPSNVHLFGVDPPGPHLPVRHRLVRPRRVVAAAVRRADLAHGGLVGIAISFTLGLLLGGVAGLLRRLGRHGHHARHRAAAEHPVALPDHRAARACSRSTCRASRSTSASSRSWRSSAGPGSRASSAAWCSRCASNEYVTAAEALGVQPPAHHRAAHPAEHDVVRDRGRDALDSRLHPRRGRAVVPRRRRAGAERVVGQHAEPGAQHPRAHVVPVAAVRARHARSSSR